MRPTSLLLLGPVLALACRAAPPTETPAGVSDATPGHFVGEIAGEWPADPDTADSDDTADSGADLDTGADTADSGGGSSSSDTDSGSDPSGGGGGSDTDTDTDPNSSDDDPDADPDPDPDPDPTTDPTDPCYADVAGDGWGGAATACDEAGAVTEAGDCDDDVDWVYPDAEEWCDGIDTNCDDDLDAGALDAFPWYADADADTYGDASTGVVACTAPAGWVPDLSDCDDTSATISPGAVDTCNGVDDDCDHVVDNECDTGEAPDTGEADTGDEGGGSDTGEDEEVDPECAKAWYPDVDADGWGDSAAGVVGCRPSVDWTDRDGDCDDLDPDIFPGADETCNGLDDDCDGTEDEEAVDAGAWFGDADGDGFGEGATFERTCDTPAGYVLEPGDCDDTDAAVHPWATEVCDGIDNDCDEGADEVSAVDTLTWYLDVDGDGVGGDLTRAACTQPAGALATDGDCDDGDATIFPGAAEVCNDLDDDCDGAVDDDTAVDASWYYADVDGDGYGDAASTLWSCSTPLGYVDNGEDCDDADNGVTPGRRELCDGVDNNCDGAIDESGASGEVTWYRDGDADGAGDSTSHLEACDAPSGYVDDYRDCDDTEPDAYPDHVEVCGDGIDNDCDGVSALCGPWGVREIVDADASFYPEAVGDDAGRSVAFVGDVDADGLDDLAVGGTGHDGGGSDAGVVWLLGGGQSGEVALGAAMARLMGETGADHVGWAIAAAGDLDSDGHADLVLGADTESTGGVDAGAVYIVSGPLFGDVDLHAQRTFLVAENPGDRAGYAVDGGEDADGDGVPDVVVGAPYEDSGGSRAGAVYVVSGGLTGSDDLSAADGMRYGEAASDRAGTAASFWGDADGDGIADLLVGAWSESTGGSRAGAAYLVLGPVSGVASLSSADEKWLGESAGDRAGLAVAAGGDVDGDGLDDALVGAPYGSRAYVLGAGSLGGTTLASAVATLEQETTNTRLGGALAGRGDVDGDGYGDVAVGAWGEATNGSDAGAVYVLRGPLSGAVSMASAEGKLLGESTRDLLGTSVSIAGDADADGLSDILVGSPGDATVGTSAGAAWLFYGTEP